MTLILRRNRTSIYVEPISKFLKILPPVSEDSEVTELVGLITQLRPGNRKIVHALLVALIGLQADPAASTSD